MREKNKLRIIFIVQNLVKGGAERLVLEICHELKRRDAADVLIVGQDNLNDYPLLAKNIDFIHVPVEFNLSVFGNNKIDVSSLQKVIHDFKPDVIHTNCYMQEAPVREYLYKNIAYFSHFHDNMPAFRNLKFSEIFIKKRITEFYEKIRLVKKYKKCNNTFIAISEDTYKYFKRNLSLPLSQNIILLPNAINFNRFYSGQSRKISLQKELQLINIGHFAPKKNQMFLLKVLKKLKGMSIPVHLKLVGDCENVKEKFIHEAGILGISDNIEMVGMVDDVEVLLRDADIYVHSAFYEPFGLVLLEAMASGLPIVCLDGKGNRDVMKNGENGYIIEEQDPLKFAEAIKKIASDENLYNEMSKYCVSYAKEFDIKLYVDKLLLLYRSRL